MNIKLNVKDKSVYNFLSERLVNKPLEEQRRHSETGAYNLMQDKLYFVKECGIAVGEHIKIELSDWSSSSRKELINEYIYCAYPYDDVSIEMALVAFRVYQLNS